MNNKIYLVEGCEGSYEDFHTYIIKVFSKKENAEKFVEEYNKKIDDINNLVCDSKLTKEDYYNIECDDNGPILPDGITIDDYNKIEEVINESYREYGYANIIEMEIEDYEFKKEKTNNTNTSYEEVNHPDHYNVYDVEVVEMMERIFGIEETMSWCKLNAFKYRMRAGEKPTSTVEKDLKKEKWCLDKYKELINKN